MLDKHKQLQSHMHDNNRLPRLVTPGLCMGDVTCLALLSPLSYPAHRARVRDSQLTMPRALALRMKTISASRLPIDRHSTHSTSSRTMRSASAQTSTDEQSTVRIVVWLIMSACCGCRILQHNQRQTLTAAQPQMRRTVSSQPQNPASRRRDRPAASQRRRSGERRRSGRREAARPLTLRSGRRGRTGSLPRKIWTPSSRSSTSARCLSGSGAVKQTMLTAPCDHEHERTSCAKWSHGMV